MKVRSFLTIAATSVLALGLATGVALAQDPETGGVTRVAADAACAATADVVKPAPGLIRAYRIAYNTTDNTDDGPLGEALNSPAWQNRIYQEEMHRDYLAMNGWKDADPADVPTFRCNFKVAVFPALNAPEPEPTTVPPPPPTTTPVPPPTTNPVPPTSTSVNPPPVVVNPPPNTVVVVPPAVNNSNDVPVGGVATGDGSSL